VGISISDSGGKKTVMQHDRKTHASSLILTDIECDHDGIDRPDVQPPTTGTAMTLAVSETR
jgi:hypothetical protein